MNNTEELNVINNEQKSRFEIKLTEDYAYVDYRSRNGLFELLYIFVPPAFRGTGVAESLIKHVLDECVNEKRKINIYCSWIAGYVRRHPEYHDLVTR
jgi:uncharacterized protein